MIGSNETQTHTHVRAQCGKLSLQGGVLYEGGVLSCRTENIHTATRIMNGKLAGSTAVVAAFCASAEAAAASCAANKESSNGCKSFMV